MKGSAIAFISIALFSLYVVFGKMLLVNVSPFIILFLNQMLAGVILVLILDLIKRINELKNISKKDIRYIYIISIFSSIIAPLLFLVGLGLTSATNTILIGKSEAVLTSILAIFVLKEKITIHQILGTLIMFTGIIVIATDNFGLGLSLNIGDFLILISALSYAVGTILFKKHVHHIPPEVIVTLRNLFGASMLFIMSLFMIDFSSILNIININFIAILLGLVIFTSIIGQYLWYKALDMTSATNVSIAGLTSPLIAIFYAIVLLKESLVSSQIFGGILIMIGLIIIEFHIKTNHSEEKHRHHLKLKHWPHI